MKGKKRKVEEKPNPCKEKNQTKQDEINAAKNIADLKAVLLKYL